MPEASAITRLFAKWNETHSRVELSWSVSELLPEPVTDVEILRNGGPVAVVQADDMKYVDRDGLEDDTYILRPHTADPYDPYADSEEVEATSSVVAMCTIQGTLHGLNGSPVVAAEVRARNDVPDVLTGGQSIEVENDLVVTSDTSGVFAIDLPQGIKVRLEIDAIGYTEPITVPEQGSAQLSEISRLPDLIV